MINESRRLQSIVNSNPLGGKESVLLLHKGMYEVVYAWHADEYCISNKNETLIISTHRLSAFGVYIRNFKLTDKWCKDVMDYIRHYDDWRSKS